MVLLCSYFSFLYQSSSVHFRFRRRCPADESEVDVLEDVIPLPPVPVIPGMKIDEF